MDSEFSESANTSTTTFYSCQSQWSDTSFDKNVTLTSTKAPSTPLVESFQAGGAHSMLSSWPTAGDIAKAIKRADEAPSSSPIRRSTLKKKREEDILRRVSGAGISKRRRPPISKLPTAVMKQTSNQLMQKQISKILSNVSNQQQGSAAIASTSTATATGLPVPVPRPRVTAVRTPENQVRVPAIKPKLPSPYVCVDLKKFTMRRRSSVIREGEGKIDTKSFPCCHHGKGNGISKVKK